MGDSETPHEAPAEIWSRVAEIFRAVAGLEKQAQKQYLERHCGTEAEVRREVESLLGWAGAGEEEPTAWIFDPQKLLTPEDRAGEQLERPEVGRQLGAYELLEELGQGGMSRVFLARRRDDEFQMQVAVKVLKPGLESPDMLLRLRQERQILAGLSHPHIAHLLDGGSTSEGAPFFVLEYVPGEPIDEYCDRRGLSLNQRLTLFLKVCGAVQYAHRNLIIHRDLKPSNLLVTPEGEPKLLDFGIAKLLDPGAFPMTVSETRLGMRLLTPEYASPEQFQGRDLNTATDVYSLGMILYRLLTGRLPFPSEGRTLQALEKQVCEQAAPLSSQAAEEQEAGRGKALKGDLDRILTKVLEKDPEARYESVERFADDLRRYLTGLPVSVRRPSVAYRARRFVGRHRTAFTAAALMALLLVAVVAYYTFRLRTERDEARQLAERLTRTMSFVEEMATQADPSETNAETVTVRTVIDRMAQQNQGLDADPALQAAVMVHAGRLYRRLALYVESEAQLAPALEIRRRISGDPLAIAESAKELGNVHYYLGRRESAEALLEESWQIRRNRLGEDDPLTLNSRNDLAVVLEGEGRLDEAEAHFREVLRRRRIHDPTVVGETLTNLGGVRWTLGDLGEAEALYRQALEWNRGAFGDRHRDTTTSMNNLAALLATRGEHAEAETLFAEALAANRELFGDLHPFVSRGLHRWAGELGALGRRAEAADAYEEALLLHRQIAPEDPRIVRFLVDFAGLWVEAEDCSAAAPLLDEALERSPQDTVASELVAACGS